MAINSDEQQNAALSWTKALTKNKEIVTENSNRLIPKGSKLNLKNPKSIDERAINFAIRSKIQGNPNIEIFAS